jgi:hypothetical protein
MIPKPEFNLIEEVIKTCATVAEIIFVAAWAVVAALCIAGAAK